MLLSKTQFMFVVSMLSIASVSRRDGNAEEQPATTSAALPSIVQPVGRIGTKATGFAVSCFALAPGGDVVALGSDTGNIALWSLAANKVIRTIDTGRNAYIGSVAFSPDEKALAFHADDDPIRLWDLEQGVESARLTETLIAVEQLSFAKNGKSLGIVSDSLGMVWNLDSGKVWKSEQPVSSLAFSPDGKTLAMGFNTVRLLKVESGNAIAEYTKMEGSVAVLRFSPTGHRLLAVESGCRGTTVRVIESESGEEMIVGEKTHADRVGADYSDDGKTIVVSDGTSEATFWNAATGEKLGSLMGIERSTNKLVFTPDGRRLLSGRNDSFGDVLIWAVPQGLAAKLATP